MSFNQNLVQALKSVSSLVISVDELPDELSKITLDSRNAKASSVFVAIQGLHVHGNAYIKDAINNGVRLVITETCQSETDHLERTDNSLILHISDLSKKLPTFLQVLFPQINALEHVIAVTGTNGKTSVTSIYAQLASALGYKSATVGTLGVFTYDGRGGSNKLGDTINTTPDIVQLFSLLASMADMQITHVAIEASSHGIEQGRLNDLPIDTVVFTNLTQDHLDYHKTMQAYAQAKRAILKNKDIQHLVYNADDPESQNWLNAVKSDIDCIGYALSDEKAELRAFDVAYANSGLQFRMRFKREDHLIELPLLGTFNVYNYLSAVACFLHQGVHVKTLQQATSAISGVNGRMELTQVSEKMVLIDYAHTPDALQQALLCARQHTQGSLWVVFGCGGDRDKDKRAKMGHISSQLADHIVLTQDNPRTESPDSIIADIVSGMDELKPEKIEHDRVGAVQYAVANAMPGDTILLAGKGHETYIEANGQRDFYDERALVKTLAEEYV